MARLTVNARRNGPALDIGSLYLSDATISDALHAGGELLATKTRAAAENLSTRGRKSKKSGFKSYKTGETARSVALEYNTRRKTQIEVTFKGERKRGRTTTRNGAIAFYNEYGVKSHGTPARNWIKNTNNANEAAVVEAMAAVVFKEDNNA